MPHRTLDQRLSRCSTVRREQIFLQGAGIDPDTDRHPTLARRVHHGPHVVVSANISGIDSEAVNPFSKRSKCKAMVKMDIGDERNGGLVLDLAQC